MFNVPQVPGIDLRLMSLTAAVWPFDSWHLDFARTGIRLALSRLRVQKGSSVLVPTYICDSVIDAVHAHGASTRFYEVPLDLNLSVVDVERAMRSDTSAVLVVHYFGFQSSLAELRVLCDERNVALIEDSAHVIPPSGTEMPELVADVRVYSWRKHLPTLDGASVLFNNSEYRDGAASVALQDPLSGVMRSVYDVLDQSTRSRPGVVSHSIQSILEVASNVKSRMTSDRTGEPQRSDGLVARRPNPVSVATYAHSRVDRISEVRRRNYRRLHEMLAGSPGTYPMFSKLEQGTVPWVYPVRVESPNVLVSLRSKGIPAVSWGGVRHGSVPKATATDELYEKVLFLPIHQGLRDREIELVATCFLESVRAARGGH